MIKANAWKIRMHFSFDNCNNPGVFPVFFDTDILIYFTHFYNKNLT